MDFYSAYGQGFVRVAACTMHTAIGEPSTNADTVLQLARDFRVPAAATVLTGGGFRSAAIRAILNGVALFAGDGHRRRTFDSLDGALAWSSKHVRGATAAELRAAVGEARAAVRMP